MSAVLLDVNLLIALAWPPHTHHERAHAWFAKANRRPWATCALTQLAFVRISSNPKIISGAATPREATALLQRVTRLANHVFWNDDLPVPGLKLFGAVSFAGHRQVTDAYLIELARHHQGRVATFDKGLPELVAHAPTLVDLIELID